MLITSVIIFVLISLTSGQFTDCDKGNPRSMVIYDQIEIPATFKIGGETNSIKVYANLLEDLQSEDLISIEISKNLFGGLKFKAPCIFGQGSCTKTFGDWFLSAEDMICDLFKSMNLPCQPRIAAGNYGYELELPVDLQIIPWVFRKIVAVSVMEDVEN